VTASQAFFWGMLFSLFLTILSCEKEIANGELLSESLKELKVSSPVRWKNDPRYNEYGRVLQEVFSEALESRNFKRIVHLEALKRTMGDTEFLIKDILVRPYDGRTTVSQFLSTIAARMRYPNFSFDNVVTTFPSLLVGVRGEAESWELENHTPAVAFLPTDFKSDWKQMGGTKNGAVHMIDLERPFGKHVVVVIHLSERHKLTGEPINTNVPRPGVGVTSPDNLSVGIDDVSNTMAVTCEEPLECPDNPYTVTSFNVTHLNGQNIITYTTDVPVAYCRMSYIQIARYGPSSTNGTPERIFNRTSAHPGYVVDAVNLLPNTNYTYIIKIQAYYLIEDTDPTDEFDYTVVRCGFGPQQVQTLQTAPVLYPPMVSNFNSFAPFEYNQVEFSWNHPSSGDIDNIVIDRFMDGTNNWLPFSSGSPNYQASSAIDGSATGFSWNMPDQLSGQRIWSRIRTKRNGLFSDPKYDLFYPGHVDDGKPLQIRGVRFYRTPGSNDEIVESYAHGDPEFVLNVAVGGAWVYADVTPQTLLYQHQVPIALRPACPDASVDEDTSDNAWTDSYYVIEGTDPFSLIESWNNALHNSLARISVSETESLEPTEWITQTGSSKGTSINASVLHKRAPSTNADGTPVTSPELTVTGQFGTKQAETINYHIPMEDYEIGVKDLFYWDEPYTALEYGNGVTLFLTHMQNEDTQSQSCAWLWGIYQNYDWHYK
ncbi:MAG: hypothetical protein AB3N16_14520, partial [Flavobacteriaceae bacterium]